MIATAREPQIRAILTVVFLCLFIAGYSAAEMPDCGDYRTEYMGLRVLDSETHMPIVGAQVIVTAYAELDYQMRQAGCSRASESGYTDEDGDAVVQIGCPQHDNICGYKKTVEVRHSDYRYVEFSFVLAGTYDSVGAAEKGGRVGPMEILRIYGPVSNPDGTKWGLSDDEFDGFVAQIEMRPIRRGH